MLEIDRPIEEAKGAANRKGTPLSTGQPIQRTLLVGVDLPDGHGHNEWSVEDSLAELAQLAVTAGLEVVGSATQRLKTPHPAHYLGSGKIEEIASLKGDLGYELVVFDDELSPSQQRNLEDALGVRVIDRNALIIYIFARRAQTHEGRLQVQLAQLEYELPRLAGQWSHLERQAGATSTRGGPGETQLEVDRRKARKRISDLKAEIEKVRNHRSHYRQRRKLAGLPIVALVGYTNAGKSTLINALTKATVTAEDKLFATLDPTTRRLVLPSGQEVLITDTVGFIQKLPPTLVAAFRATLEELESADVLLHVVDVTHRRGFEQSQAVLSILADLGLKEKPIVTALNKVDRLAGLSDDGADASMADVPADVRALLGQLSDLYPNGVAVSATRGWGLATLGARVESVLARQWAHVTVRLPYSADDLISLLRKRARITDEEYTPEAVLFTGHVPTRYLPRLEEYLA